MNAGLAAIILVLTALGGWFGIPAFFRWWATGELGRRARRKRAIVLSYDDGPGDMVTPQLMALLKRRQVRATFFVIGDNAARHPDTIKRLHEDGHEIGNHTRKHRNAWKTGPLRGVQDIRQGAECLADLGLASAIFRPPFGKSTLATLLHCLLHRTRLAFWTHDSQDSWKRLSASALLERLRAAEGGVVLMHDFDRPRRGPSPENHPGYILDLTEKIIDFAESQNFKLLVFSDLFDHPETAVTRVAK